MALTELRDDATGIAAGCNSLRDVVRPWQALLQALPIGAVICDRDGMVVHYNPCAAELWGRSPAPGRLHLSEICKIDDATDAAPDDAAPLAAALAGQSRHDLPLIVERGDGTRLTVLSNIDPLTDASGNIVGALCCFQDSSASERAHDEVRRSQELLHTVVETTPECVKIVARDGTLRYMNPAGLQMIGARDASEVEGASIIEVIAPEERDVWRANHERICAGEKLTWSFDIVGLRGTRRHMETHGAPMLLPDGETAHLAVTRDITQRRRDEDALRISERHCRELLETLPAAVYTTDAAGNITFYNRAAVELAGRQPELGDQWCVTWRLYTPDGTPLPHEQCPMAIALKENRPIRGVEAIAERPDGTLVPFMPYPTPLRDASGTLVGAVNMLVDLTERKHAEAALRDSEERFRRVFEQSPLGKATAGPDFRFRSVNPALCRMLGYREDELIGRELLDFVHPEDRETCLAQGRALIAAELSQIQLEERFLKKSGDPIWVSVTVGPIRDPAGNYLYGLAIVEDIDERRRVSERLHQSEQRLRELNDRLEQLAEQRARQLAASQAQLQAFFHNSPDWLTLQRATADGRFVYVDLNATCEEAYGLPRDQVVGRSLDEVLGAEAAVLPRQKLGECLRTGKSQRYVAHRRMAGRMRIIDVMCVLVPHAVEGDRLIITTARDITERHELEAQLRQAQKMEVMGQLTGGVAHDFNNLLTAITGNLELLEIRLKTDSRWLKHVLAAQRAAERGADLTAQLLAFSRRQHHRPETVDVNEIVRGMDDLLVRTIGQNCSVHTVLATDLWPALADRTQLEIAVLNLAINARDAMPTGGAIVIETGHLAAGDAALPVEIGDCDCVVMSVVDSGIGMSEEVAARAIEPFFTTKEIGKGSGLGLSQVYGFAQQCGGTLKIDSRLGRGTTVRLYLPRSDRDAGTAESDVSWLAAPRATGRILLADDDAAVREIAAQMLRQIGYGVTEVENGYAAIDALARGEVYDLLLIDLAMPGLSGTDTVRRIREQWPMQRILLVTGYADAETNPLGADQVLRKPFKLDALAGAVATALLTSPAGAGDNVIPLRQRQ
jgi:PAS domain S-box-containing protein